MKALWRVCLMFGVLFLLATAFADGQDKAGKPVPSYYPLQVGNQWTFKVTVGDETRTAVSRIAKIETIDKLPLARLEASVNGNVVATEHLLQTEKGIFRYRNNDKEISPPIILLDYASRKPDGTWAGWGGDIKVGNDKGKYSCEAKEESVEVPLGKYRAVRVAIRLESKGQSVTTTYWFAKDVGIVRQTVDAAGLSILMELEKIEPAK
jgi:hypothetical protein